MNLFVPKMYQSSIYTINYKRLKKKKIKCLLFDLDNTCVGYHEKEPTKELEKLFSTLKNDGFRVIIFSNAPRKRLIPFQKLGVVCHSASKKPFRYHFLRLLRQYGYQKEEVCIIGDQLFTDIYGGNRVGILTCLVEPMTKEDFLFTKIFRMLENMLFCKFERQGKLRRGNYYE